MRSSSRRCIAAAAAIGFASLVAPPSVSAAGPDEGGWVSGGNTRARLNWCPSGAAVPNASAPTVAFVEVTLDPGWKTYWRMPGDAGVAPTFDWSASPDVSSATVAFPAPHRMADQGGEAIGYKSAVVFPVTLNLRNASATAPPTVAFAYGICKNICIPVELNLKAACHGQSAADVAALDAVPRLVGAGRPTDPKLVAVTGSVLATKPQLTIDIDFGRDAAEVDLFIEAPEGLYVPLPAATKVDSAGRARFVVDLSKTIDAKDLLGKQLRLTMVGSKGSSEAVWVAK